MLETLRKFIDDFASGADGADAPAFDENDYRLAAAALMVHVIQIDGVAKEVEWHRLRALLEARFDLDTRAAEDLVALATRAEGEAVDLYRFTSLLNRTLNKAGRLRIVEMLWELVYADGEVSEFEDNVLWRAADLLHVEAAERVEIRNRVANMRMPDE